jgi:hypothetical protein
MIFIPLRLNRHRHNPHSPNNPSSVHSNSQTTLVTLKDLTTRALQPPNPRARVPRRGGRLKQTPPTASSPAAIGPWNVCFRASDAALPSTLATYPLPPHSPPLPAASHIARLLPRTTPSTPLEQTPLNTTQCPSAVPYRQHRPHRTSHISRPAPRPPPNPPPVNIYTAYPQKRHPTHRPNAIASSPLSRTWGWWWWWWCTLDPPHPKKFNSLPQEHHRPLRRDHQHHPLRLLCEGSLAQ